MTLPQTIAETEIQGHPVRGRPGVCRHCGDLVPRARRARDGAEFCCEGCAAVYALLRELDYDQTYYSLRGGKVGGRKPADASGEDFSALDAPPFRTLPGAATLDFFLEGIHCTACVWILERLPEMNGGILAARLDAGKSLLRVTVAATGKFEDAARLLVRLGYPPHPVRSSEESAARLAEADRSTLKRMGVAAFAAMNVMIYSVALYANVAGGYAWLFRILSLLTALPALTYSAWPFYQSAVRALRGRRISIDLPISLAFIGGFAESTRQVALGTNLVYLDSITSLVFLMLGSRYALSRLERAELSKSGILQSLLPARVRRREETGEVVLVRASALRANDRILLHAGEKVPADGEIVEGAGAADLSFLTGESKPVALHPMARLFAGSRIIAGDLEMRVAATGRDTCLGEIETKLDWTPPRSNLRTVRSDRWARVFLASVLGLAIVLFLAFGPENIDEAVRRSLSLLIIACPCALALATPLTLARAFRLAASHGILVRDFDAFDRILEADRIVIDKTGTLTTGRPRVSGWHWDGRVGEAERNRLLSIAYSLEARARHPYGKAIVAELENRSGVRHLAGLSAFEEAGLGTTARFDGRVYGIGRPRDFADTGVEFRRDGELLARIEFADEIRPESAVVVAELRKRGLPLEIFSGDAETIVGEVARSVGIAEWRARVTPEGKALIVEEPRCARAIAIGDGVNDALALRRAFVGIAFNRGGGESLESSLSANDVVILRPDLGALVDLLEVSRKYRRTLRRNAAFSIFYNLVGASFAAMGHIHPLVAAIAMPVSALTVFLSTAAGLRESSQEGGR